MFCRISHWKPGWVLEIDPKRIETADDGTAFIRLDAVEPGFMAADLAASFRSMLLDGKVMPNGK